MRGANETSHPPSGRWQAGAQQIDDVADLERGEQQRRMRAFEGRENRARLQSERLDKIRGRWEAERRASGKRPFAEWADRKKKYQDEITQERAYWKGVEQEHKTQDKAAEDRAREIRRSLHARDRAVVEQRYREMGPDPDRVNTRGPRLPAQAWEGSRWRKHREGARVRTRQFLQNLHGNSVEKGAGKGREGAVAAAHLRSGQDGRQRPQGGRRPNGLADLPQVPKPTYGGGQAHRQGERVKPVYRRQAVPEVPQKQVRTRR